MALDSFDRSEFRPVAENPGNNYFNQGVINDIKNTIVQNDHSSNSNEDHQQKDITVIKDHNDYEKKIEDHPSNDNMSHQNNNNSLYKPQKVYSYDNNNSLTSNSVNYHNKTQQHESHIVNHQEHQQPSHEQHQHQQETHHDQHFVNNQDHNQQRPHEQSSYGETILLLQEVTANGRVFPHFNINQLLSPHTIKNKELWSYYAEDSLGEINPYGLRDQFVLGKNNQKRYAEVFDHFLKSDEIYVMSDSHNSTMQGTTAQLMGTFYDFKSKNASLFDPFVHNQKYL